MTTRTLVALTCGVAFVVGAPAARAQAPPHTIAQLADLKRPAARNGLSTTIAEGNPRESGTFTMMLKLDDGGWIPPHFHNVDKRLMVVRGQLLMGRGETIVALIANGPLTTTMVGK